MSPRSDEYMEQARNRLRRIAQTAAESGDGGSAVSLAYYAMLNAANAARPMRESPDYGAVQFAAVDAVF